MAGLIAAFQWVIANWQLISTLFSSVMSVMLFFMHGNAKSEIQELRDFIASLQVSQPNGPIDTSSAQAQAQLKNPKV